MDREGRHLHFDDHMAVTWYHALGPALADAEREGKSIFVQLGRPDCGGCRALVERVIPKEEITDELRANFVCVCADIRELEPAIAERFATLPRREPTPVCMFLDSSGRVVHSTIGGRPPAVFLRDLTEAESKTRAARRG
jgi:uncharacterized protein YyaL (SSP411 family)